MKKLASLVITHALLLASLTLPAAATAAQQQRTAPPQTTPAQTPLGQSPQTTPQRQPGAPAADDDEEVVRITTNLVQIDAVVVDKKGKQVTDLTAEEFEVFEDKRPQKLTNFSYVLNETAPSTAETAEAARPKSKDKASGAPPAPPRRLRPEQVRRTMALVVDDLGLSFESTSFVRDALRKFVNEQMQPNDLVAIIRTSAGMGALQQFTSDKRQLHAAIDRVKWYMGGRGGVSVFAPLEGSANMPQSSTGENPADRATRRAEMVSAELEDFREEIFSVGTLGALNFVVRGMRELPGRKSVLLLSDGFSLYTTDRGRGRSDRVMQAMRQLTDLANRASVVVYSIDARGLTIPGFTAADDLSGMTPQQIEDAFRERSDQLFDTQSGLAYLSQQTGGFLIKNNNDLTGGIRRVVEDQKGYYLLGYRPESATFDRRYHRISVKVKRPGLRVRTRTGFYGIRDEETRPVRRTREQQLYAALTSPFASPDVRLRLMAYFGNTEQDGSFMRSMLHLDARDVQFRQEPDGKYKAVLDVVAVTFGDNGRVIESLDRIHTLTLPEESYRRVLRDGITYNLNVPVKKPGAYQLRMAVRDTVTERTGSASQFIEVPDLKKNRLALSGLILTGFEGDLTRAAGASGANQAAPAAAAASPASPGQGSVQAAATGTATNANADETGTLASPAVRRFRQRAPLALGYAVYNARLDKATGRPQLTTQTRIYRDGELFFSGKEQPVEVSASETDLKRIGILTQLKLSSQFTPGEYVIQVIVTDTLRNDKHRIATQSVDFEIYK
ncbi:MAG TPA: VWA domain-containing protein [Pyrinomonadaceae bacterium]|nr:VWA domain-containing protein [Pyrinomonadaceae bacterium]